MVFPSGAIPPGSWGSLNTSSLPPAAGGLICAAGCNCWRASGVRIWVGWELRKVAGVIVDVSMEGRREEGRELWVEKGRGGRKLKANDTSNDVPLW